MIWKETVVACTTVGPTTQELFLRDWKKSSQTTFGSQSKRGTGIHRIKVKTLPFTKLYGNFLSTSTYTLHALKLFGLLREFDFSWKGQGLTLKFTLMMICLIEILRIARILMMLTLVVCEIIGVCISGQGMVAVIYQAYLLSFHPCELLISKMLSC